MSLNTSITNSGTAYRSNSNYGNSSLLLGNASNGGGGTDYTLSNVTYPPATSYMANSIN